MKDKMEGKIFNARYKIVKLIGKGGTAIVYQADDIRLKRKVAIKILKEDPEDTPEDIKSKITEIVEKESDETIEKEEIKK
jgi:serine/threonine protein kinase